MDYTFEDDVEIFQDKCGRIWRKYKTQKPFTGDQQKRELPMSRIRIIDNTTIEVVHQDMDDEPGCLAPDFKAMTSTWEGSRSYPSLEPSESESGEINEAPKKNIRIAPTHFLCFLIDEDAKARIAEFSSTLAKHDNLLSRQNFSWRHLLHITCATLHLPSEGEIEKARSIMQRAAPHIYDVCCGTHTVVTNIGGLDFFGRESNANVLWLNPMETDMQLKPLHAIRDYLCGELLKEGLPCEPSSTFHITIARKKTRSLPVTEIIEKYTGVSLGTTRIGSVILATIGSSSKTEFYQTLESISLP